MVAIKIKKGLDIPILGKPSGQVKPLKFSGQSRPGDFKTIALNLSEFGDLRFSLLVKVNDIVKIGDPLAEDGVDELAEVLRVHVVDAAEVGRLETHGLGEHPVAKRVFREFSICAK